MTTMIGGFTFKGIHSSTYNVRETPSSRILSPRKRRELIEIPGRSTPFIQEDGGYEPRVESIICSYARQKKEVIDPSGNSTWEDVDIYEQVRKIAGWLVGIGQLSFDYEPNLYYNAYVSTAPSLITMLEFAQFQVEFTIVSPFAFETPTQRTDYLYHAAPGNKITINREGTVNTPVKFIITNNTNFTLTKLMIYNKYIKNV